LLAYFAQFLKDTAEVGLEPGRSRSRRVRHKMEPRSLWEGKISLEEGEYYPYPGYLDNIKYIKREYYEIR
jgi:hypothetical protein